jgi:hypothetical protein
VAVMQALSQAGQATADVVVTFVDRLFQKIASLACLYKDELVAAITQYLRAAVDFVVVFAQSNGQVAMASATSVFNRGKTSVHIADKAIIDYYNRLLELLEILLEQLRSSIRIE